MFIPIIVVDRVPIEDYEKDSVEMFFDGSMAIRDYIMVGDFKINMGTSGVELTLSPSWDSLEEIIKRHIARLAEDDEVNCEGDDCKKVCLLVQYDARWFYFDRILLKEAEGRLFGVSMHEDSRIMQFV
jgi:hypothetical protein